ncbi:transglycosylase SLT domain-containing protein [Brucella anthropi]|uniref:transglycosylase SLT domain-containing protein n=1 Tax=Brucella anthropi TaxID=529 RepID=UPI003D987DF2
MAILPTKNNLSGPSSLRSGRQIASFDTTAIGRGISQAGNALVDISNEMKQRDDALGLAKAEAVKSQGLIETARAFDNDPDYASFGQRAPKVTSDIVNRAAENIKDPNLRARWIEGARTDAARTDTAILNKADALGQQATKNSIDETLEAQRRIYVDPQTTEEEKAKALSDIRGTIEIATKTGIFTPDEAERRIQINLRDANYSRAKLIAETDPGAILRLSRSDVGQMVVAKAQEHGVQPAIALAIGHIESGLNANAKASTSSASGVFQLIDRTGKQYGVTNPFDADQNIDAGVRLTRDNINGLRGATGREPTPGEIYLAHFSGLGTAQKLAATPDDAPASDVFSAAAIKANPSILAGKSAGEVKAWAERKMAKAMGQSVASADRAPAPQEAPQWFKDMSPEQRQAVYQTAEQVSLQQDTRLRAQQKAEQDSIRDNYALRIATNDPTLTTQDILGDTRIDDGMKASLINSYDSAMKGAIAAAQAVSEFANGTLRVDPYSTDGKKKVDAIGDAISKNVAPDQQQSAYEALVQQSGTVPQPVVNRIRAGAESQNANEVLPALQSAARFSQVNPAALGRTTGGDAVQRKVDDFDYYVNTLNLDPQEAARRIAEQNDPNKVRDRKALEPAAKEFRKSLEGANLGALFDESYLPFNTPNVGFTEGQAAGIAADYMAIAEEQFFATGGNAELAKTRAEKEMKRLYGVSDLSGAKTVMKYPPERYWPAMPGESDPYGYAKDQLVNDLAEAFPDDPTLNPRKNEGGGFTGEVSGRTIPIRDQSGLAEYRNLVRDDVLSRVILVATPETGAEVKSNQLPGYTVLYKDAAGNLQTLYGKQWRPDASIVGQTATQQQQDRLGRAEIYQQTGRGMVDFVNGGTIPAGASSAWDNPEAQQIVPSEAN